MFTYQFALSHNTHPSFSLVTCFIHLTLRFYHYVLVKVGIDNLDVKKAPEPLIYKGFAALRPWL